MNAPFTKANLALAAALVVQVLVLLFVGGDAETPTAKARVDAVAGVKPFAALDLKDVATIVCKKRESAAIRLEKTTTKDGDKETTSWVLADRDRFPAKAAEAERLVDGLKKLTLSRVLTRHAKRYAGLNVADDACDLKIVVLAADGRTLAEAFIGEARDFNQIHLRKAGDEAVYAASGASTFDFPAEAQSVAETKFMDLDATKIVAFKVTNESGAYEAVRETPASRPASRPESGPESAPASAPAEAPKPYWITRGDAPQKLDDGKVESWLRGIAACALSEPVGKERKPEHGFDKPAAVVTLTTDDGKTATVTVGAERKEQFDWYVTATGKDHVVTVKSYNVTDWFKKALKDLAPGSGSTSLEDG